MRRKKTDPSDGRHYNGGRKYELPPKVRVRALRKRGLPWRDIAQMVYPDDYRKKPYTTIQRVKELYMEGER